MRVTERQRGTGQRPCGWGTRSRPAWPGNAEGGALNRGDRPKPKVPGMFKGLGVTLKTLGRTIKDGADTVQYRARRRRLRRAPGA